MKVTYFPQASVIVQKVKEKLMDSLKGPREFEDFHILHNNVERFDLYTSVYQKLLHRISTKLKALIRNVVLLKSSELCEFSAC